MHNSKVFSKIDLRDAYNQIELSEESKNLTTFITEKGLYRFNRLCFGVSNASEIFQRALEHQLGKLRGVKFISDDIIVHSPNEEQHAVDLKVLFTRMKKDNLTVNKSKCKFFQTEIKFYGVIIGQDGIKPDPAKIEVLQNAAPPSNVSELRSFLGLCTHLSRFIPDFSTKTAVLRELLKKSIRFKWTETHQQAFELLTRELTSDTVLAMYDPNKRSILVTDASNHALGGILLQKDEDGYERPVHYVGTALRTHEKIYSTIEKEAYALIWCIEKLHLYSCTRQNLMYVLIINHSSLYSD